MCMCILSFDVHVCSAEHSDLPLVQRFMNALWFGYVDHIILDVNKKAIHFAHLLQVQLECAVNGAPSVAQLDAPSDWRPGGRGFNPRRGRQYSFVEIDHEIFSTVILFLPLIQEGQLSVSGERICTILVNRLED